VNVTEPLALSVQVNANNTNCTDPKSGSIVAVALGGTSPYGYLWSNAGTTDSISGLPAGPYDVTVTDAVGCTTTGSTTVIGDTMPQINLGLDRTICTGDSVVLDAGSANAVWSTGFTGSTITVHDAGQYWAMVTAGACTNTDTVTIVVSRLPLTPVLNITDSLICDGDPLLLTVNDLGDLYTWSTGDTALEITVDTAGTYIVYAINGCGTDSAQANITSDNCNCILYMPNVFSPNGDGKNDTYRPVTLCDTVQGYVFKVFDRWGNKVFESRDINQSWDGTFKGTLCDPAVFVWNLSYITHNQQGQVKQYYRKGTVTLLR
jgi:gliding motility-associated-like protein